MTALLLSFLQSPILLAIGGGIIAAAAAWFKGRLSGAKAERNKQLADEAKARDIADEIQNDVGAIPNEGVLTELKKWSRD